VAKWTNTPRSKTVFISSLPFSPGLSPPLADVMKYKCQEMVLDSTLGSGRAQKCYKGQRKSGKDRNAILRENIYSDIERYDLHKVELHNLYSSPNII
jgi:hypothetical protein